MAVALYDQRLQKYQGESGISMRFYNGSGFFGDIGTIGMDLTKYGDLSGEKRIAVFAKSLDSNSVSLPQFTDLKIWNNYMSFD